MKVARRVASRRLSASASADSLSSERAALSNSLLRRIAPSVSLCDLYNNVDVGREPQRENANHVRLHPGPKFNIYASARGNPVLIRPPGNW